MEFENRRFSDFINEVCQYMKVWNSYANVMDNSSLDKICAEPYADFKKQLKLFYRALDPLHKSWFSTFFTPDKFYPNVVRALLEGHWFSLKTKSKTIFIGFLYICSFTYSLLHYCEKNGMEGMLSQIQTLISEAFTNYKARFIDEGGLNGLRRFCSSNNLPTILQFISDCYCEQAIFSTYVFIKPKVHNFGLHDRETIDLFMNNLPAFESSVRDAFDREINVSPIYKQAVDNAFLKLQFDLQNGPSETYLSKDRAKIAADPTSPLSRI